MSDQEPARTKALIGELLESFGMNPADHLVSENEGRIVFGTQRGSAQLYMILSYDGQGAWLQVISPILGLPPADKREACFEHLLKLNAGKLINCALGIDGDKIVVTSDRSTEELQLNELRDMMLCVSKFADDLDDEIAEAFDCPMLGDSVEDDS